MQPPRPTPILTFPAIVIILWRRQGQGMAGIIHHQKNKCSSLQAFSILCVYCLSLSQEKQARKLRAPQPGTGRPTPGPLARSILSSMEGGQTDRAWSSICRGSLFGHTWPHRRKEKGGLNGGGKLPMHSRGGGGEGLFPHTRAPLARTWRKPVGRTAFGGKAGRRRIAAAATCRLKNNVSNRGRRNQ